MHENQRTTQSIVARNRSQGESGTRELENSDLGIITVNKQIKAGISRLITRIITLVYLEVEFQDH